MTAAAESLAIPRPRHRRARTAAAALALPVALLLAFVATNVYASLAQRGLDARWAGLLAEARGLTPVEIAARATALGDPVARLRIPSIGLDAVVVEGASPAEMRRGPAHLPGTPLPGEDGVAAITANRFGFGGFFSDLERLAPGDRIVVETLRGPMTFTVQSADVVPVERLDFDTEATQPVLLLFASARRWGGGDRLVVRAYRAVP